MKFLDLLRGLLRGKRATDYSATYGIGNAGGFAGGAITRLTNSLANWSESVNADLDGSLTILRARGRQMAQNNEYGRRFLTMVAANIVGAAGPKLQVRAYQDFPDSKTRQPLLDKIANDAVEVHFARWCKRADITGRMDFAHLARVAAKATARDGEALVRIVRQPGLAYGMALQLLEADRLDDQLNRLLTGGGAIRQGVEIDSAGRAVAYWIKTAHPGERYTAARPEPERVPAAQILHIFLPERAEQVRGFTWFHAIILRNMQLHGFNDAAVTAARIGASKIAALERAEESTAPPNAVETMADGQAGGALQMNVEAGEMFELPPGYKLSSWNPDYPHANYESFVKAAMRGIAAGLDVATHNLSGDMTDVNYSSARIAELAERDNWITLQSWFIRALVEPVYEEWLAMALLRGDITFPNGKALPAERLSKFRDASRFQGRRWRWVDPAKEIAAAKEAVALGITSRTRLAAEQGEEFDDVLDELTVESASIAAAKLAPVGQAPAPAPDPEDARGREWNQ